MKALFSGLTLHLTLVIALAFVVPVLAADPDPVVLQAGEQTLTLGQFNQQFEMAMVLTAVREGVPNKSGVMIRDLKERFLQSRARDMLLKQYAGAGIEVSRAEEDVVLADLVQQFSDLYDREQAVLRQEMETLREWIHEELLLQKIRHALIQNASPPRVTLADQSAYLEQLIDELGRKSAVRTWPDRLD